MIADVQVRLKNGSLASIIHWCFPRIFSLHSQDTSDLRIPDLDLSHFAL